jgi:hypothetical protein
MTQEQETMEIKETDINFIKSGLHKFLNLRRISVESRFGLTTREEGDAPSLSCGTRALLRAVGGRMFQNSVSREHELLILRDPSNMERQFNVLTMALRNYSINLCLELDSEAITAGSFSAHSLHRVQKISIHYARIPHCIPESNSPRSVLRNCRNIS